MASQGQSTASILDINLRPGTMAVVLAVLVQTVIIGVPLAQAQTYTVLHTFTGGADGGGPEGGLMMDAAGNLYGTTYGYEQPCGSQCGTVFKMKPTGHGWVLTPLYKFSGGNDGGNPYAAVVFGPDGALYGTTDFGGSNCPSDGQYDTGCGTVFRLTPQPTACNSALCPWTETVLYRFTGGANDGALPTSQVTFDTAGNLYGTTYSGGVYTPNCYYGDDWCGTIFKLTHSNGGWTESVPYIFTGGNDGANPIAGLTADAAGNFYGAAEANGKGGGGTIFELTPSGSGWTENTLLSFIANSGGGYFPRGELIFDPAGNLYGTTEFGGEYPNEGGTVFELSPSGGGWTITGGYSLPGVTEHGGPLGGVVRDSAGNLYGTAFQLGSNNVGLVFKLTPSSGGWTYTVLHEFAVGDGGDFPSGNLVLDAQGNLYGTAGGGGAHGWGVVWEITP
jgi:uncharacterized repeat protein (TIGR03803 family)